MIVSSFKRTAMTCALLLTSSAYGAAMKNPDIQLNPNPRMKYEITVTIDGAPGDFERIEGSVDYIVSNEHCVPVTPITGATIPPEKRLSMPLRHVSGNVYKGELFMDALQDEDYFGMGVCHWSVVAASANLYAHRVDVSASLFKDDMLAQKAVTRYYSYGMYFQTEMDVVDAGHERREDFKDVSKTYAVTLKSEEKHP